MAIERTYLYDTDRLKNMENSAKYLQENAVPKYFDRVELSADRTGISCYIEE